jgi:hypothetical protein
LPTERKNVAFLSGETRSKSEQSSGNFSFPRPESTKDTQSTSASSGSASFNFDKLDEYVSLLTALFGSYENLTKGNIATIDLVDEDYEQIDPDDLEAMDL